MTEEHNLVLILARGLAASMATPVFLVDPEGTLIYYNEPAEEVLGLRYADAGPMKANEWGTDWAPEDPESGEALPLAELPLGIAVVERRPAHREMRITGIDGAKHVISVTAFPLYAKADEFIGAVAIFWETQAA